MATRASIGIRLELAYDRLARAMAVIAEELDVEPAPLPKVSRHPEALRAEQIEVMATWAENVATELGGEIATPAVEVTRTVKAVQVDEPPRKPNLNDMTKKELYDFAAGDLGLDVSTGATKAELIAAIEDAGGMSFDPNPFDENKFDDEEQSA